LTSGVLARPGASRLDTELRVETPEGIELSLRPAGPVPRALALAIDLLLRWVLVAAVSTPLALLGGLGIGGALLFLFVMEWFFPVLFEVLAAGQTPGKRSLRLRVVHTDATPVGWTASIVRNLLRVADFAPLFYVAGAIAMCASARFQRLGDMAAGTLVVHVAEPVRDAGETLVVEGSRPAPVALRAREQRALISFAERAGTLSAERRVELADVLADLTGARGETGLEELVRIARGVASGS
jgi:uncharacterized RDD family membrane protein YckC